MRLEAKEAVMVGCNGLNSSMEEWRGMCVADERFWGEQQQIIKVTKIDKSGEGTQKEGREEWEGVKSNKLWHQYWSEWVRLW